MFVSEPEEVTIELMYSMSPEQKVDWKVEGF
jgi:hypothetical protein